MKDGLAIAQVIESQHKYSMIPHVRSGSCKVFSIPQIEIFVWSKRWNKWVLIHDGEISHSMVKWIRRSCGFNGRDVTMTNIRYLTTDIRGTKMEHYSNKILLSQK